MLPEDRKPLIYCYHEPKRYVVIVFSKADSGQIRHVRYGAAIYRSDKVAEDGKTTGPLPDGFYARPEFRGIRETMRQEALKRYRTAPRLAQLNMNDFKRKPPALAENQLFDTVQVLTAVASTCAPKYQRPLNRLINQVQELLATHAEEKKAFSVWYRASLRKMLFRKHGCFGARLDKSAHLQLMLRPPAAAPLQQIASVQEKDEESKLRAGSSSSA